MPVVRPRNVSGQQPNLELSSGFAGKFEGSADKSEKLFECKRCTILTG